MRLLRRRGRLGREGRGKGQRKGGRQRECAVAGAGARKAPVLRRREECGEGEARAASPALAAATAAATAAAPAED